NGDGIGLTAKPGVEGLLNCSFGWGVVLQNSCPSLFPAVFESSLSGHCNATPAAKRKPPGTGASREQSSLGLAVAGHLPQLFRQEMIWRPRSAYYHLAVLELLGGRAVAVLILLDRLGVDQVGYVEQHAVGCDALAAHFFFERIEKFVDLHGEGASFGLAFAVARGLLAELGQVFASHRVRQDDLLHIAASRAVAHDELDAHLRLAAQPLHALTERAAVRADSLADRILGVENCSKAKGYDGCGAEALAY